MRRRPLSPSSALIPMLAALSACGAKGDDTAALQGAGGQVDLNPASLHFELPEGGLVPSQTQTFTVQNHGVGPLSVSGLELQATGGVTLVEGGGAVVIPPHGVHTVTVAFEGDGGDAAGRVIVYSDDAKKPVVAVSLEGELVPAESGGGDGGGEEEVPVEQELVDVFLLLDVAYNYSCYHPDLDRFIDEVIDELYVHFDNVAVGFGVYDDYPEPGWTVPGNKAYEIRHQISTDHDSVKEAARGLTMEYGGRGPGSTHEALYQAVWGAGYDHECDGVYDEATDVPPFTPRADDAFGGLEAGAHDPSVPGTGERRGVGWREGAAHIVIVSIDNMIRDAALTHPLPEGTCGAPASPELVARAFTTTDTRLLGINVYEWQDSDPVPQAQLEALVESTGSHIDADGDGLRDEPAVLAAGWDWPPMWQVMDAVEDLIRESHVP